MAHRVFIDGQAGTTGLRLAERLNARPDIELLAIDERLRKDVETRVGFIADSDVAILCLPDAGSVEIADAMENKACRVIDCSTAFRAADGWSYGMPELVEGIRDADLVSNPGCHATGFIMSVRPLVDAGILDTGAALGFLSLTGYSGGGKAMIAEYEEYRDTHGISVRAPMRYALGQEHKHLPEILKYSGLEYAPVFSPIVCDFYSGMLVSVPLPRGISKQSVYETLAKRYESCPLVKVRAPGYEFSEAAGEGYLSADAMEGRDDIELFVIGKDDKIEIVSRYDNLGKGASGAAIQNMNLMLGLKEETGLVLGA